MKETPNKLPTLDYATPERQSNLFSAIFAAELATVFGPLGGYGLFMGIQGIIWLIREWPAIDGQDVMGVAIVNLIGFFCIAVSIGWIGYAIRRFRR